MTDLMKNRNMEEDMAEDRHLWRLGVDRRLLAVYFLYISVCVCVSVFIYLYITSQLQIMETEI